MIDLDLMSGHDLQEIIESMDIDELTEEIENVKKYLERLKKELGLKSNNSL